MNEDRGNSIHMVGIGGAGMSALAGLLLDRGARLTGSDRTESSVTRRLGERGVILSIGAHRAENVPRQVDRLIHSSAVGAENVEVVEAGRRGALLERYSRAVGRLLGERRGIAIAGTHGKTTTAALVAWGLRVAGREPSFVIGGEARDLGTAGAWGPGADLVVEACEHGESFLDMPYEIGAILNVEADHLDVFGDLEGVRRAFRRFAGMLPESGRLLLGRAAALALGHDESERRSGPADRRILTFALEGPADVTVRDLSESGGCCSFALDGAVESGQIVCRLPGRHFAEDALAAATVLAQAGVEDQAIVAAIGSFRGVGRRLEPLVQGDVALIYDYAHHPTELSGVNQAIRAAYPGRRLLAVFQPHQASRTRHLFAGLVEALSLFDRALVSDIFVTRDSPADRASVSSADLAAEIRRSGGSARPVGDLDQTMAAIREELLSGDVLLLLGAGDIDRLRDEAQAVVSHSN